MDILYPDLADAPANIKVSLYSTAYNTGYYKGDKVIRNECDKERFYVGMIGTGRKYNYAEIAVDYYLSLPGK